MNVMEIIQSYFGGESAERLGQVAGLDAATAGRVLGAGLPMQLDALADHAGQPDGQAQIAEAIQNLPSFGSVADVLRAPDGASNLQRAGELLAPALLGGQAGRIMQGLGAQTGASGDGIQKLMHMALPLLLSLLGQRGGLGAGNVGSVLGGLKGSLGGLGGLLGGGAAAAGLGAANAGIPSASVPSPSHEVSGHTAGHSLPGPTVPAMAASAAPLAAAGPLTASSLIDFLKGQLGGAAGERIGAAVGFGGSGAGRATMAALPVVLGALAHKGRTEEGAGELMNLARPLGSLMGDDGNLRAGLLDDSAELGRVEGQGRGLLGSLLGSGNVDQVTGRLGTALGGSGANAGRLLSLVAPLVLSLLGGRARAGGLSAGGLSGLLGGLGGLLPGLLPSGLSGLSALLSGPPTPPTVTPTVTPAPRATAPASPPRPVTPPPAPPASPVQPTARRGGFPWWLLPLLLLLGAGGCYLATQNRDAAPATTAQAASIIVTNPTSDANLPPEAFTMSGTGPADTTLRIEDEGQEVATATVGADGNWSAEIPAPTPGAHTYSVIGGEGVRSEFKVNITEAGAGDAAAQDTAAGDTGTDSAGTEDTGTDVAPTGDGTFAISEPAEGAALAAGGFTLRGTGQPGDSLQVLEDGTSLGNVTVAEDGTWSLDVPSPAAGARTYSVQGADGTELGTLSATIGEADANASAAACTDEYSLSIGDGQTVSQPFRFGGKGNGEGYSVTVRRGERTIGTRDIPLDSTCGWSYQSRPGVGDVTYEVRPLGDAAAEPLSTVNLTVSQ